jgi:hypothetical protein
MGTPFLQKGGPPSPTCGALVRLDEELAHVVVEEDKRLEIIEKH